MSVYYVDNESGDNSNSGLSPVCAVKSYTAINVTPGDTVLFKCGNIYNEQLIFTEGTDDKPVKYSCYGSGHKPVFVGSTDVSDPSVWTEISCNIWRCTTEIPGEAGNFLFNFDECTATLRWDKSQLAFQGDFWDSRFGNCEKKTGNSKQELLLYSVGNPGNFYKNVQCISYNKRVIGVITNNIIIEDLHIKNSGVHGFAGRGKNVSIRRCVFENIGGCVWDKNLKIRFGNAVEFWVYAENVLIENCIFKNVYDSCVTHQGPGEATIPARNFTCRSNLFDTYGMAAFEYRDKLPVDSCFENNICINAGCGFAMLGDTLPRSSEIWPQPMGHHIFLWRMPEATPGGRLKISDNIFGNAPVGACVYSIISADAEKQIELNDNVYLQSNLSLINRYGNKDYDDFYKYTVETGCDRQSIFVKLSQI